MVGQYSSEAQWLDKRCSTGVQSTRPDFLIRSVPQGYRVHGLIVDKKCSTGVQNTRPEFLIRGVPQGGAEHSPGLLFHRGARPDKRCFKRSDNVYPHCDSSLVWTRDIAQTVGN